eukprot:GHVT01060243.1.p1 GENE.GHVT01060243.1~~GHVT01060243.1.p1  ORF type:complete len:149 (+),score=3.20 GHVT01060243.1:1753-2199(+)
MLACSLAGGLGLDSRGNWHAGTGWLGGTEWKKTIGNAWRRILQPETHGGESYNRKRMEENLTIGNAWRRILQSETHGGIDLIGRRWIVYQLWIRSRGWNCLEDVDEVEMFKFWRVGVEGSRFSCGVVVGLVKRDNFKDCALVVLGKKD